jgi:hypothetical protein
MRSGSVELPVIGIVTHDSGCRSVVVCVVSVQIADEEENVLQSDKVASGNGNQVSDVYLTDVVGDNSGGLAAVGVDILH